MIRLFWLFLCALSSTTWANSPPQNLPQVIKGQEDILLVIHYNHAHWKSIPFLKELYGMFPHIVFYGETPHPSLADACKPFQDQVHLVSTNQGYFFSRVVEDVMSRYPQYKGYIFMQDDIMMNLWNFSRLDPDKIWFAISFHNPDRPEPPSWQEHFDKKLAANELFNPIKDTWWGWWKTEYGLEPLKLAMKNLSSKERKMHDKNIGKAGRVGMVCDMFYIPGRLREDALHLGNVFQDVFCEIAIPMMLCCLDPLENWEYLRGHWGYNPLNRNNPLPDWGYLVHADWVHAMKFSNSYYQNVAHSLKETYLISSSPTP